MPKKNSEYPLGYSLFDFCIRKKKGGDLLSHKCSTIGAVGLNFSVRNGKRWNTYAITTIIFSVSIAHEIHIELLTYIFCKK